MIFLKWFKLSWLKSLFLFFDGIITPANDDSGFGILDDDDDDDDHDQLMMSIMKLLMVMMLTMMWQSVPARQSQL